PISTMSPDLRRSLRRIVPAIALALLAACAQKPVAPPAAEPSPPPAPSPAAAAPTASPVGWAALDGWQRDDPAAAWPALRESCERLGRRTEWKPTRDAAGALPARPDAATARAFFEQNFQPWRLANPDGSEEGMVTGYYEPLIHGSLEPSARYRWPIRGGPKDMLTIELGEGYPDLKALRLRGGRGGYRAVAYWPGAEGGQ